jgi:hypothetical protein
VRRASGKRFILVLIVFSNCRTWSRIGTPQEAVIRSQAQPIRVTKSDLSVVVLQSPMIVSDSLIGTLVDDSHARVAIAMADVRSVETRQVSALHTLGAGYLAVLAGLFLALLVISIQLLAVE